MERGTKVVATLTLTRTPHEPLTNPGPYNPSSTTEMVATLTRTLTLAPNEPPNEPLTSP